MSAPEVPGSDEQHEIDADRRAEWWLVLQAFLAVAAVVLLVLAGLSVASGR